MRKLFGAVAAIMLALALFSSPAAARCWSHGGHYQCWHHRYHHRWAYRPASVVPPYYSARYYYPYQYYPAAYPPGPYYGPVCFPIPIWPFCWY